MATAPVNMIPPRSPSPEPAQQAKPQPKPQPKPQQQPHPKPQQQPQQQPQQKPQTQPQTHNRPAQPEPTAGPSRSRKRPTEETGSEAKRQKKWYDDAEVVTLDGQPVTVVRAEKIPGQKKITSTMSNEEKLRTARENENIRLAAVQLAEQESGKKIMLAGKFLNLGIPEGGYYIKSNENHRQSILNTATTPKPPAQAAAPRPPAQAPAKPAQTTPKPPAPTAHQEPGPSKPPEKPKKTHQWLSITYKGIHFRIVLTLGPSTSVGKAEAVIHVNRLPETDQEMIELFATNENLMWRVIQRTLPELSQEEKTLVYNQILESYKNERHGNLK